MKKTTAYKTDDNRVFEHKKDALAHEERLKSQQIVITISPKREIITSTYLKSNPKQDISEKFVLKNGKITPRYTPSSNPSGMKFN